MAREKTSTLLSLELLDEVTHRLRQECPWDREQNERSIVPHTVEEAYELADAAHSGDHAKMLDELGDVLFQVYFLSMLLEERGAGNLADVAEHCRQKLIRRHPHVFGEVEVEDASDVLKNWDQIKSTESGRESGVFGEVPENLPGLLYARKLIRRARSAGYQDGDLEATLSEINIRSEKLAEASSADDQFDAVGDLLFAVVSVARALQVDPELAVRESAKKFKKRVMEEVNNEQD